MAFVNLLEAVYPVGSVYISTVNTSPSSLIGGTWAQISNAVLRASNAIGYVGSDSHAITINEMPSHNHVDGRIRGGASGDTAMRSAYAAMDSSASGNYGAWFGSGYNGVDNVRIQTEGGGKQCRLSSALTIALFGTEPRKFFGGDVNGVY